MGFVLGEVMVFRWMETTRPMDYLAKYEKNFQINKNTPKKACGRLMGGLAQADDESNPFTISD